MNFSQTKQYSRFAFMYDDFMGHVPYGRWTQYLISRFREFSGRDPAVIIDAACGTGPVTSILYEKMTGSVIYGFDLSESMLQRFSERMIQKKIIKDHKLKSSVPPFRCLSGDCRLRIAAADIRGPVPLPDGLADWIISTHDALNYMLSDEDFYRAMGEMNRLLKKGGIFSFDMVTYENIIINFHKRCFSHEKDGLKLLWKNRYRPKTRVLKSVLDFTDLDSGEGFREVHLQKYRTPDEVIQAAEKSGFSVIRTEGDYRKRSLNKAAILMNFHFVKV